MKQLKHTVYGLICVLLILAMSGCKTSTRKPQGTEKPDDGVAYEKGVDFVGVIRAIDTDLESIEFYDVSFNRIESYPYSGGTEIMTKNEKQLSALELEPGQVFDVYTSDDGRKIVKMQETAEVTRYENVSVKVDSEQKRLSIRESNYAYTDNIPVFSEGKLIQPMEITPEDKVTFRGKNGQAYSIIVTRGHGYIQPKNYKDFLGGTVTVQGETILPVSKNMLLSVPEGTQVLRMDNGDLTGEASIEVKRGHVTEVNMAQFQSQVPDTARVRFRIRPEGAELYVNGSLVDASKLVSLKYGNHSIRVVLEGYNDYAGVVNVQDPNPTIKIDLSEEKAEVEEEDSSSSVSNEDSSGTSSNSSNNTTSYDKDHKVTVSAPKGAAVYVDGTYKGEAPCSFTKMIGSVTVTLTKEGYETKSYSIQLSDDSQDVTWSFPDLTKKGNG